MQTSGTPKNLWYLRRGGQQAGPFSSAAVRRLLLQEQVGLEDEVSRDRQSWRLVRNVEEVVPPQLRGSEAPIVSEMQGRRLPWQAITVFVLVVSGILGLGFWWGGSDRDSGRDCAAAPQSGVDLRNCRLRGLKATGADLKAAWLQNADLFDAALTGADLSGTKLDYANLGRADLAYSTLRGASLRGADLRYADLTNADLDGADLRFADLTGAVLPGATLKQALLGGALWLDGRPCRSESVGGCRPETASQGKDSVR